MAFRGKAKDTARATQGRITRRYAGSRQERAQAETDRRRTEGQGDVEDRAVARYHTHSEDCDPDCTAGR